MEPRDELQAAADALDGSVVVCGIGVYAASLAGESFSGARFATVAELLAEPGASERPDGAGSSSDSDRGTTDADVDHAAADSNPDLAADGNPDLAADSNPDLAAVVVAVDPALDLDTDETFGALAAIDAFTVAVLPGTEVSTAGLSAVGEQVDGVLLVGDDGRSGRSDGDGADGATASVDGVDAVAGGIREFLAVMQAPGFVNLDLADAQTVLSTGVAALGTGAAARDAPTTAIDRAFGALPDGVDPAAASAVLVDVVVDPVTSIAAATDVVAAVRERIGGAANVIWGGAVDESATDEIRVRVVVADVRYAPTLEAGDPCPRCEAALSSYALGARETLSCDACGYSGIAVRRE